MTTFQYISQLPANVYVLESCPFLCPDLALADTEAFNHVHRGYLVLRLLLCQKAAESPEKKYGKCAETENIRKLC
jgi:hypothetical protein